MKKVLIFGKDGQLGHDCARVFNGGYLVLGLNRNNVDITKAEIVSAIIEKEKPDLVINATAYNKVEAAEIESKTAFNVNAKGVENLVKASELVNADFVHVSTDYVFDGSKEFFTEEDAAKPLNVYGRSKLKGEQLARQGSHKCYIIRTSAVFGVKEGNQKMNFVDRMVNLAKEGKILKVVSDQITSPTYSWDLAGKIKELIEKPAPFGIYHITNSGSCSWYEFTLEILRLIKIKAEVVPITTNESGSKVNRPKMSVLKDTKMEKLGISPMPAWQDALQRYLQEKYS